VDFSLILFRELSLDECDLLLKKYAKLKRFILNLGEIEIYLESEWLERELLKEKFPIIQFVRDVRKVHWTEVPEQAHPYHHEKRKRALQLTAEKYGSSDLATALSEEVERQIEKIRMQILKVPSWSYSDFLHPTLGWNLTENAPSQNTVQVSEKDILLWLAIQVVNPFDSEELKQLRQTPVVAQIWTAHVRHERLGIVSIIRSNPAMRQEAMSWLQD
jgi:hypothetical protein